MRKVLDKLLITTSNAASRRVGRMRAAIFILGALLVPGLLAACDSGTGGTGQTGGTDLARGAEVYQRYCNVCHPGGRAGAGPSIIALSPALSDEQIRQSVRNGKNRMPPYKETDISNPDLANLIAYMRTLK